MDKDEIKTETNNENLVSTEKTTYTLEQYNEGCFKARKSAEAKADKKIAELETQIKELKNKPILEKALVENGCKSKAISHIISDNPNLINLVNDSEALKKEIDKIVEEYDYAFEKKPFVADPLGQFQKSEEEQQQVKLQAYKQFFGK